MWKITHSKTHAGNSWNVVVKKSVFTGKQVQISDVTHRQAWTFIKTHTDPRNWLRHTVEELHAWFDEMEGRGFEDVL